MNILWYWTPATGSAELPYYLIEKTDRTGQFPNNYNHTPDTGGPVTANITAIVDALYPLFEAKEIRGLQNRQKQRLQQQHKRRMLRQWFLLI